MADQFLGFTKALAWPVIVIWVVLLFRKELRLLLDRLSQFKWGDLEAKFSKAVADSVDVTRSVSLIAVPDNSTKEEFEPIFGLASISPRASVLESWMLLENEIRDTAQFAGFAIKTFNVSLLISQLSSWGKVPPEIIQNLKSLRDLRNAAVHVPDVAINLHMANDYIQLAQTTINALKAARTNA